jgi:FKBP-type peptidyl-prolyl cis-trans isomerase FkpA
MRKLSLCLLFAMALLSGCFKKNDGCSFSDNNITAPASEVTDLENYLSGNGITAVKHPTGFYYEVLTEGTGAKPELCSVVNVGYAGKLTNGKIFDQTQSISFRLGSLIEGWRKGLPLIQKGGHIKLYLPPTLGYGAVDITENHVVVVPANSILIFDINLIDVQ